MMDDDGDDEAVRLIASGLGDSGVARERQIQEGKL